MKGFPIGSIIPWSGSQDSIPRGWIICNGANVATTRYPLLYEVIGNTYGGTVGSTFRIPPLTNTDKAIVDIFRGYYQYLKGGTNANSFPRAAHAPDSTSLADDPFWSGIGQGNNGDEPANNQITHISTIDVVGEIASSPNFVAEYGDITLTPGEETISVSFNPRKLGDAHVPAHGHALENQDISNRWRELSRSALINGGNYRCGNLSGNFFTFFCFDRPPCVCNTSSTSVSRARRYLRFGNDQTHLREEFGANSGPAGGGGSISTGIPIAVQEVVILYYAGDGYGRGDMLSSGNVFWTNLSNAEVNFSQINGHAHGSNAYTFRGNLQVVNPGIVSNVSLNNVAINNSSGVNFGTITMNSATANLSMLFIIKAF